MVQDSVADLVGHLVRMAHGDGFTREKISFRGHGITLVMTKKPASALLAPWQGL